MQTLFAIYTPFAHHARSDEKCAQSRAKLTASPTSVIVERVFYGLNSIGRDEYEGALAKRGGGRRRHFE